MGNTVTSQKLTDKTQRNSPTKLSGVNHMVSWVNITPTARDKGERWIGLTHLGEDPGRVEGSHYRNPVFLPHQPFLRTEWFQAPELRGSKGAPWQKVPGTDVHVLYHKDAGESMQGQKARLTDKCWAVTAFIFVSARMRSLMADERILNCRKYLLPHIFFSVVFTTTSVLHSSV